ncbi:MAG: hypothetical protein DSO02_04845 [Hadesarchaea archaeon]|nr:MAG: hypothetical protein DSO02_04845 [Hadesarchaea archaeon]
MNRWICFPFSLLLFLLFLPPSFAGSSIYSFQATYRLTNTSSYEVEGWLEIFVFDNENFGWDYQVVLEENFFPTPQEFRGEDNRVLKFLLGKLSPGSWKEVRLIQLLRVEGKKWERLEREGEIPQELLKFTAPVPNLWEDAPELKEKAEELRGETPYLTARNLFEFVKNHLRYENWVPDQSALQAYRNRVGKCTEFTNLFIALARLSGLPAKFLAGYGYNSKLGENAEEMGHAFAILYLPGVGWVPVDETWMGGQFGELGEDHLILFSSDGSNLVKNGRVSIPGEKWSGGTKLEKFLYLYREAAVEADLKRGGLENGKIAVMVTLRNTGRSILEDLTVRLEVEEDSFRPVAPQMVKRLSPREEVEVDFYLEPLRGAENSPLRAEVWARSPYGEVSSESTMFLTVVIEPAPSPLPLPSELLLSAVAGLVVVVVLILLLKRR